MHAAIGDKRTQLQAFEPARRRTRWGTVSPLTSVCRRRWSNEWTTPGLANRFGSKICRHTGYGGHQDTAWLYGALHGPTHRSAPARSSKGRSASGTLLQTCLRTRTQQVKSSQVKSSQVKSSQVLFSKLAFAHERSRHQCGKSVVTDTRGAGHSLGRAPLTEVHQKTCCTEAAVVKFTLDYEFVPRMLSCDALRRLEPAEHASATPIERV